MSRVKTSGESVPPSTEADAGGSAFVKARRVRSFDDVVEQVRSAVFDGTIGAGERLPSERELAEQFGVSRATLREALRALEASGIIEIRVGAHGGAFATEGTVERSVDGLRQVFDVEAAMRPRDARRFRASLHADNLLWVEDDIESIAALEDAIGSGSHAFLLCLGERTGIPFRAALAAAVESHQAGPQLPSLTTATMEHAVELLRAGRRGDCREQVYAALAEDESRSAAR